MDWNKVAVSQLALTSDVMFEAHRGAYLLQTGVCVLFGNDGYAEDERARKEVELLREPLQKQGAELAFALTEDSYSWVLIARDSNPEGMNTLVWLAWSAASGEDLAEQMIQIRVATEAIAAHKPEPTSTN